MDKTIIGKETGLSQLTWAESIDNSQVAIMFANKVRSLVQLCHSLAIEAGWWTDPQTGKPLQPNIGEKLALIHSEISEALEGVRKGLNDDHLPNRKMFEVELADAVIRILDLAGYCQLDLGGALVEKLQYNTRRADHKLENRAKEGGKKF